jgi:hypothetical protein
MNDEIEFPCKELSIIPNISEIEKKVGKWERKRNLTVKSTLPTLAYHRINVRYDPQVWNSYMVCFPPKVGKSGKRWEKWEALVFC